MAMFNSYAASSTRGYWSIVGPRSDDGDALSLVEKSTQTPEFTPSDDVDTKFTHFFQGKPTTCLSIFA